MPSAPTTYDYAATDCRVVDGDTVEVTLVKTTDVGFGVLVTAQLPRTRLRLAALDAKPLHTPQGDAATQWLHDQVLAIGGRCKTRWGTTSGKNSAATWFLFTRRG
jgi:endonuclease YncB( thermonuclease family)